MDRLAAEPFDLVLLDVMMPVLDGIDTLARIKADPELRHLSVIMISAASDRARVVRCLELGAADYLPKPFDRAILRARVGASLERKRLRDSPRSRRSASGSTPACTQCSPPRRWPSLLPAAGSRRAATRTSP